METLPSLKNSNGLKTFKTKDVVHILSNDKLSKPSLLGGPALDDPSINFVTSQDILYMDFIDDFGALVELNLQTASSKLIKPTGDPFFVGFINIAYVGSNTIKGMTPTVEEEGFCSDGCFAFGKMNTNSGIYAKLQDIPFKEMADDSHFFDEKKNIFYVQGGYDLRKLNERCAPVDSDECLLRIDANTGNMLSAKWVNFTVYKYANYLNDDGTILGFLEGFEELCDHPYDNFLFANVDLEKATAIPIKCIPKDVVIHEAQWISSFSKDNSLFATASGDAEGESQLIIFESANANVKINNHLEGLGKALNAAEGLFWIWSVDFIND